MEATLDQEERPPYSFSPPIFQPYPWLVLSHGEYHRRHTFFNISQHRYYTKIIPEMRNKTICCSSFGWMVLVDNVSPECFLLNLASMKTIQLPLFNKQYSMCVLTAPPTDPNCHVLFIDHLNGDFQFCSPCDSEFSKQNWEDNGNFVTSVTTIGGKTYCFTCPEPYLLAIEFEGSNLRFTKLNDIGMESKLFNIPTVKRCLVDFFGEILLVCTIDSNALCNWAAKFEVFRLDFDAKRWVEVKNIGNNAIFLADQCCGSCYPVVGESDIRRNSIYYTQREDRNLYVYGLEDQSVTTYLPCPIVSRRGSSHYWCMLPSYL